MQPPDRPIFRVGPARHSTNTRSMRKSSTLATYLFALTLSVSTAIAQPTPNFMQRDADGNGRLTQAESGLSDLEFRELDRSANGELSLGEFGEYWSGVSSQPAFTDLSYGPEPRQKLNLYLPPKAKGAIPLVLWIHGGSWETGDKEPCPFKNLTEWGFAVAALNYRLVPDHPFPAPIDDCRHALTWLKKNPEVVGVRFSQAYSTGLSAGGHLSLMLGGEGSVDGVIAFAAPSNLDQKSARKHYEDTLEKLLGGPLEEHPGVLQALSPALTWSAAGTSLLLFHGLEDRKVPYTEAGEMARAANHAGSQAEVRLLPDGSHTVVGGPQGWARILEFLGAQP